MTLIARITHHVALTDEHRAKGFYDAARAAHRASNRLLKVWQRAKARVAALEGPDD